MKKREKSDPFGGADKGEFIVEEKRKRASRHTRIGIDFDPKTFKLGTRRRWINTWPVMTFVAAQG